MKVIVLFVFVVYLVFLAVLDGVLNIMPFPSTVTWSKEYANIGPLNETDMTLRLGSFVK
jgi:hypothetical protein